MISFGPVPSRRLGKSLGINNIVAPKTCSYNCFYCQVGKTIKKTSKRESFFTPREIYNSVSKHLDKLKYEDYPDYLTFVANGEPSLDINLGQSIRLLKNKGIPVAVISNASLLFYESVREDLSLADWVSLKMDAADAETWQSINRPDPDLDFENIQEYILLFSRDFKGRLCTETMLIEGLNTNADLALNLAHKIKSINPWKAYLSVPVRPTAEKSAKKPDAETLNFVWQIFNKVQINTELLAGFEGADTGYTGNIYEDILNITAVHPLREDSMINLLRKNNAGIEVVKSLIEQRLLKTTIYDGYLFYIREYSL